MNEWKYQTRVLDICVLDIRGLCTGCLHSSNMTLCWFYLREVQFQNKDVLTSETSGADNMYETCGTSNLSENNYHISVIKIWCKNSLCQSCTCVCHLNLCNKTVNRNLKWTIIMKMKEQETMVQISTSSEPCWRGLR